MAIFRNSEDLFWNEIDSNPNCKKYTEMYQLLKERICYSEFYDLCKAFLDIALNASKIIDQENLSVQGCFQDSDINKTVSIVKQFINTFNIQKTDELLSVIRLFYPYAADFNDKRQQALKMYKNAPSNLPRVGVYINFCKLPENIWNEISELILSDN